MKKGLEKLKNISRKNLIIILVCAAVIFAAAALIIHFSTRVTNDSYENCSLGDIDGNGYINAADALLIIESNADDSLLFENQKKHADVNLDGTVNSSDSLILMRYIVGEIRSIPFDDTQALSTGKQNGEAEKDKELFTVQILNKWNNGNGTFSYQINCAYRNSGKTPIDSWNGRILFNLGTKVTKSWGCTCKSKSKELTVSGKDIPSGSSAACGFIVTASEGLTINSVEIGK